MPRKTNKTLEQERRRKLFHVNRVTRPDDLLDKKLLELKKELIDNLGKKGKGEE